MFHELFCPDVIIIDGNAMLYHTQWPINGNVGSLIKNFVSKLKQDRETFRSIFDHYIDGSIKSHERERRACGIASQHLIINENTPLPNKNSFMANENNKRQLIKLLCSSNYNKNSLIHLIGENNCEFEHEEADVMMISYVLRMIEIKKQNIHIVSDDTDVFVLLLHYYWIYKPTAKIQFICQPVRRKM